MQSVKNMARIFLVISPCVSLNSINHFRIAAEKRYEQKTYETSNLICLLCNNPSVYVAPNQIFSCQSASLSELHIMHLTLHL